MVVMSQLRINHKQQRAKMRVNTHSRTAQYTEANGKAIFDMGLASNPGLMGRATKVNGKIIRLMDAVCSIMSMVMSSMENGIKTRLMDLAPISM